MEYALTLARKELDEVVRYADYHATALSAEIDRYVKMAEDVLRKPEAYFYVLSLAEREKIPPPPPPKAGDVAKALEETLRIIEEQEARLGRRLTAEEIRAIFKKGKIPYIRGLKRVIPIAARMPPRLRATIIRWAIPLGVAFDYIFIVLWIIFLIQWIRDTGVQAKTNVIMSKRFEWEKNRDIIYALNTKKDVINDALSGLSYRIKDMQPEVALSELNRIKSDIRSLRSDVEANKDKLQEVGVYDIWSSIVDTMEANANQLETQILALQKVKREHYQEKLTEAKKYEATAESLAKQIAAWESRIKEIDREISDKRAKISTLRSEVETLKSDIRRLEDEKKRLEDERSKVVLEKERLHREMAEAQRREDWARVSEIRGRLELLDEQERRLTSKIMEIADKIDSKKKEMGRKESEISYLEGDIRSLESEKKRLQANVNANKPRLEEARAKAEVSKAIAESVEEAWKDVGSGYLTTYETHRRTLITEAKRTQRELESEGAKIPSITPF